MGNGCVNNQPLSPWLTIRDAIYFLFFFCIAFAVTTTEISETIVSESSLGGDQSKAVQTEPFVYLHAWSGVLHEQGKFMPGADFCHTRIGAIHFDKSDFTFDWLVFILW
jgi:hypothetical protein